MNWLRNNLISLIIIMFVMLFLLWAYGYIENGLHGKNFDLSSCWAGLSTLGSAGVIALVTFLIDSKMNSKEGEKP